MGLEKTTKEDKIEIVDVGDWKVIQIRTATIVTDDGEEISRSYSRKLLNPDADVSGESAEVQAIAAVVFTDAAKTAYAAAKEAGPEGIE